MPIENLEDCLFAWREKDKIYMEQSPRFKKSGEQQCVKASKEHLWAEASCKSLEREFKADICQGRTLTKQSRPLLVLEEQRQWMDRHSDLCWWPDPENIEDCDENFYLLNQKVEMQVYEWRWILWTCTSSLKKDVGKDQCVQEFVFGRGSSRW